MFTRLKTLIGLGTPLDKLIIDLRASKCENWKQQFDNYKASNPVPIADKKITKIGLEIYETIFKKVIADLKITGEEKQALNEILTYFSISDEEKNAIMARYSQDAVISLSLEKYNDTILTPEEKEEINLFARELNISEAEVEIIHKAVAKQLYRQAVEKAIADNQLTNAEEQDLVNLAQNLGLSEEEIQLDKATGEKYNYLLFLNALDNGFLPEKPETVIVLQRNETAHWETPAKLLVSKIVTTGYAEGSRGVSIRVMKGVSYRVGSSRSTPIKQEVSYEYPGILVITSKRIVFSSPSKSFSIPFTQLISFDPYSDGLGLQKANSSYLLSIKESQLAEITFKILTNAINKSYE